MAKVERLIGLSLGADICWPICFEEMVRRLDLSIPWQGDTVTVGVERLTIDPYDLRMRNRFSLVIDRLTHWYHTQREWIKKAVIMDDLYVFNNPWSVQSMEKQTTYCAMMRLGFPIPDTWMVPPKEYEPKEDLQPTLERYARFFDLGEVGRRLGYPMFMKPYDGGGWVGVSRIDDETALRAAYEQSGKHVMHLQRAVENWDVFVRCVGVGPQVRLIKYDPSAPLHDRYTMETDYLSAADKTKLRRMTLTINTFFGWDFNSCEALRAPDAWHPIDFANACPDSQVTSLHYHFPWLVNSIVRWSIYCAVTRRRMQRNLNWEPYYEVAREGRSFEESLDAFAKIAEARLETERFEEFCATHLSHFDEVADEFFATDAAKTAVRKKVEALFPEHEHTEFTDLFFERIQKWRQDNPPRQGSPVLLTSN